jgi:hemin uptake protein HemP
VQRIAEPDQREATGSQTLSMFHGLLRNVCESRSIAVPAESPTFGISCTIGGMPEYRKESRFKRTGGGKAPAICFSSRALLKGSRELRIGHNGEVYRLCLTELAKLILKK